MSKRNHWYSQNFLFQNFPVCAERNLTETTAPVGVLLPLAYSLLGDILFSTIKQTPSLLEWLFITQRQWPPSCCGGEGKSAFEKCWEGPNLGQVEQLFHLGGKGSGTWLSSSFNVCVCVCVSTLSCSCLLGSKFTAHRCVSPHLVFWPLGKRQPAKENQDATCSHKMEHGSETLSFVLLWPHLRMGRNDSVDSLSSLCPQGTQCTWWGFSSPGAQSPGSHGAHLATSVSSLDYSSCQTHTHFHVTS